MSGRTYLEVGSKRIKKIYSKTANGEVEIKKAYSYPGNRNVFSSGHVVFYHIDVNSVSEIEVDDGSDCIANAPSATKSGWTFHGWREDTVASSTTIQSRTCDSDDIHLYAVFKQTITLSYNGNSATSGSTANQTADRYYNNGNSTNASFTLRANGYAKTNYSFAKWAQGSASGTQYSAGATVSLSANTTFYAYWVATITNYAYTGGMQSFTASVAGIYKLEVWGAQGGDSGIRGYMRGGGGAGGYSYGNVALANRQTIYICVGGQGSNGDISRAGGYNGGGDGGWVSDFPVYFGAGGGATHIGKTNALLKNTSSANVFIVAGGGGGGGCCYNYDTQPSYYLNGGTGGGTSGGDSPAYSGYAGKGGTQSAGGTGGLNGSYGQGGGNTGDGYSAGGGGGYYGGGAGMGWNANASGGGGGSGYIGGVSAPKSMSNGQQNGNGYARVTFVSAS